MEPQNCTFGGRFVFGFHVGLFQGVFRAQAPCRPAEYERRPLKLGLKAPASVRSCCCCCWWWWWWWCVGVCVCVCVCVCPIKAEIKSRSGGEKSIIFQVQACN